MPEWIDPMAVTATDRAHGRSGEADICRLGDRRHTLIRHAGPRVSLAISSLAEAVTVSAHLCALVAVVGRTTLPAPSFRSTCRTAITLAAVAVAAHEEEGATARAKTLARPERSFGRAWFRPLNSAPHLLTIQRAETAGRMIAPAAQMMSLARPRPGVQKRTISDDRLHSPTKGPLRRA